MGRRDHFRLVDLEVPKPHCLCVTFGDGAIMAVDLAATIHRIPSFSPLVDVTLFSQACIDERGLAVAWMRGEVELTGEILRAEAVEQEGGFSHRRIRDWMLRNELSCDGAAQALQISRRKLTCYRRGQMPVPHYIWLSCVVWEAERR